VEEKSHDAKQCHCFTPIPHRLMRRNELLNVFQESVYRIQHIIERFKVNKITNLHKVGN